MLLSTEGGCFSIIIICNQADFYDTLWNLDKVCDKNLVFDIKKCAPTTGRSQ